MRKQNNKGDALRGLLGHNIKQFRQISGLSQENLAEKAGVSVPFMGAIERGEKWPSAETFIEIARGLDVEPGDLLRPENASAQDVKKIIARLAHDMSVLVSQSVKMLNTVAKDGGRADKEG